MSSKQFLTFAVLVVAVAGLQVAESFKFYDCFLGKGGAKFEHVEVSACKDNTNKSCHCDMSEGQKVSLNMTFKADEDYTGVRYFVDAFYGLGFKRLAGGEACELPGFKCPGKHGETEQLAVEFTARAPEKFPTLAIFVLLYRDDRKPLVCAAFPATIGQHKKSPLGRLIGASSH